VRVVRRYTRADVAACCETINSALDEMAGLNEPARALVRAKNVAGVQGPALEAAYTLVFERDGRGSGVGCLAGDEIKRLYVDPGAQRVGAGSALVTALEDEARRQGQATVRVDASPSSVGFYEGLGFAVLREDTLTRGEATFQFVVMTKVLTSAAR
jgi:GNAT superfamily N-acetyltransferase